MLTQKNVLLFKEFPGVSYFPGCDLPVAKKTHEVHLQRDVIWRLVIPSLHIKAAVGVGDALRRRTIEQTTIQINGLIRWGWRFSPPQPPEQARKLGF
ncbi:MAG: hypothetical protein A2Z75_01975 [Chloroflexi bacterium RBG_13_50_10]|nr:MAG: hypothetical protein A2Z75_01975 [Chloroflexi bacterium RBG_13_50_10]